MHILCIYFPYYKYNNHIIHNDELIYVYSKIFFLNLKNLDYDKHIQCKFVFSAEIYNLVYRLTLKLPFY